MRTTARFNYFEAPACEKCGAGTRLARRRPTHDPQLELVTYECPRCGHMQMGEVSLSKDGNS
jgi:transcription elongation factor Elf1